jgi:LysR family transcriptional regulator, glycine cleavage system transcriptional activator
VLRRLEIKARRSGDGVLALASVPTFTTKWLVPRLLALRTQHPGLTLNFHRHLEGREPHPVEVDAAIRFGTTGPGAPNYACRGRRNGVSLSEATLLQHQAVPGAWAECAQQFDIQRLAAQTGPRFEQYAALISAACVEMGVALVPLCLVAEELHSGRLGQLLPDVVTLPYGHYLCYRKERIEYPVMKQFRDWLISSAANDSDHAG